MSIHYDKTSFLRYELGILTFKAALSTRTGESPIYSKSCREHQRSPLKEKLRKELHDIESIYSKGRIEEADHCAYIADLANRISQSHGQCLHNGRFRFGIAQKLTNIHLKYLWVAGLIEEPPHCPIDGIIRDLANLNYDWTTNDSKEDYEEAIASLRSHALPRSLSVWELQEFKRREQIVT